MCARNSKSSGKNSTTCRAEFGHFTHYLLPHMSPFTLRGVGVGCVLLCIGFVLIADREQLLDDTVQKVIINRSIIPMQWYSGLTNFVLRSFQSLRGREPPVPQGGISVSPRTP